MADQKARYKLLKARQMARRLGNSSRSSNPSYASNSSSSSSQEASSSQTNSPLFQAIDSFFYDKDLEEWMVYTPTTENMFHSKTKLKVVSYNILFDLYDPQFLYTEVRHPILLSLLEETDADIIALQEVTPSSLQLILSQPWIQERFFSSNGPNCSFFDPYGVLLLSRIPFQQ